MNHIEKYALLAKEANKIKIPNTITEIAKTPDVTRPSEKPIDISETELELPKVNRNGKKPLFSSGMTTNSPYNKQW